MYESHLRLYLLPHLDRIPLAALTIAELRAMFLTISRTLHDHVGRPVLLPPKTAASARTVALDRTTVAVLTAQRDRQRRAAGVDRPNGFVFAHPDGRPYSPGYLTHRFRAVQELHGLPPIHFHDLCHGAATLALTDHRGDRLDSPEAHHGLTSPPGMILTGL
jgi:hypothetical protein